MVVMPLTSFSNLIFCTCNFSTPYSLVFEAGQISVRPQDMKSSQDLLKAANIKVIQGCLLFLKGCEHQIHSNDAL